ncbi:MAG: putative Na+/H+ antiporter [Halobacteriovoraceae bacterium]|nr:putative Na+/H+ antiporter [Halobacteriovoraceae bacterium]MCB9095914.1 putative Na+/H+ antiporter [Halobacteriovoraceae bacterium]
MNPTPIQVIATVVFAVAVIHTFVVKIFQDKAHHQPAGSMLYHLYHFLGEVECVFGLWAGVFIVLYTLTDSFHGAVEYLESLNFTEPAFVFVIMCMAGTRPIIMLAEKIIVVISKLLPLGQKKAFYITALIIGPLLGSFITEPAAMTVTAIILLNTFFCKEMTQKFKYATLGLLFVNVSIGGTLSHFAAPPVLMVASTWGWGFGHMVVNFGYKAAISVIIGTVITAQIFSKELQGSLDMDGKGDGKPDPKIWKYVLHIIFLALVVKTAHHTVFFMGLFIFFLGFTTITETYQDKIKLRESLLVGFFLAGLVTLGKYQSWWLQPVLTSLGDFTLYIGATGLTAITDNAALTYLGTTVEGLTEMAKYSLVAGAVTGGGLTVIANAPNPAGYGILKDSFGEGGISPLGLLAGAIAPTILAMICFQLLPGL